MSMGSRVADAYFYVCMPSGWPLTARRAFVLTLPVSGPLLLLWWLALPFGAAIATFVGVGVLGLACLAYPFVRLWEFAAGLWRAA